MNEKRPGMLLIDVIVPLSVGGPEEFGEDGATGGESPGSRGHRATADGGRSQPGDPGRGWRHRAPLLRLRVSLMYMFRVLMPSADLLKRRNQMGFNNELSVGRCAGSRFW